jgi:hypothetical protein
MIGEGNLLSPNQKKKHTGQLTYKPILLKKASYMHLPSYGKKKVAQATK